MGRMLVHPQKRSLTNDTMSGNPCKKIKLDLNNKGDGNAVNEDLWGDDITAEEFDYLEFQATQSCKPSTSHTNHTSHNIGIKNENLSQVDDMKQLQYELEGRVKLLSQSLDRSEKELAEERINRERIIANKVKESQKREIDLQKELEKLHSVLEFKEQEIKSVSGQLRILKSQVPDRKSVGCAESPINKNFEDFLVSSKSCYKVEASSSKVNTSKKFCRKNKLLPETFKGNNKSTEILSSILCHRLSVSSPCTLNSENFNINSENSVNSFNCNPLSVVQLTNRQKSDELLQYYINCLKNHVISLETFSSKVASSSCNKTSPPSTWRRERMCASSKTVISSLRDIMYLFSSYKSDVMLQSCSEACTISDAKTKSGPSKSTDQQVPVSKSIKCDKSFQDSKDLNLDIVSELFKPLLDLTNPKTFPNEYPKSEEIELSLSVLLNISYTFPEVFLDKVTELPIYSLLSSHSSVTSVCLTLKLLISICTNESFSSHLTHKDYNCLLCSIASFMCTTLQISAEKYSAAMLLIEDFLSAVLSVHHDVRSQMESSKCISEVINGIISTIWKYYQMRLKISDSTLIVKKGFLLLHFVSLCVPNFKEKRKMMEDDYISFVSSLLTLSKENPDLREYYDLVHNLWDFQADNSEFDLDELTPSDETPSSNEMDVTD